MPLITIIVPVKNAGRFMAQGLQSVIDQDYPAKDLIVVYGPSSDRTLEIARSFENTRVLEQKGKGLSDAWNTGIAEARGEFIAFLDSDDIWVPGSLRRRVEQLMAQSEADYSIAKAEFFLEEGKDIPVGFKPQLLQGEWLSPIPGTFLARRTLFEQVGSFDTTLALAGDVDFFARLKDQEIPMTVFPELVLRKRVHDANLSSNAEVNNAELLTLLRQSITRQRKK
jgi:glycosyltransferase involved in cell wall biosynthesis